MSYLLELVLSVILIVFICFYKLTTINYNFFNIRNIPYEKPFLCFGNIKSVVLQSESLFERLIQLHLSLNSKVYGIFEIGNPLIVIKDPELIKQITIKDFDHFANHRSIIEAQDDQLFGNSLFSLKDQKWKDMRATLSPAFTGSKMRLMFQLITECCDEAMKYLKAEATAAPDGIEMDMKEYFTRYTNDVIASSAFGLKINSLLEKNNDFYDMGKKIGNFSGATILKYISFGTFRSLMRFFNIKLFDKKSSNYFIRLVLDSMKYRTKHNIIRSDMINLLMEAQMSAEKNNGRVWSDSELVAQCFLFFIAGFDSTATMMCFVAHELMDNPDVQEKLFREIEMKNEELDGQALTYDDLKGMKYLDMVISETLRKWPSIIATDRVCTKPYCLRYDNNVVQLKLGDVIHINIAGMHRDPKNFPNPRNFDPERFNDDNIKSINPYVYAPFGLGPRNCVGSRFAQMEAKVILFHIVLNFSLEASDKTSHGYLKLNIFQMTPIKGFWLKLRLRK